VDLEKLEQGLRAARIPLKADKEVWKVTDPRKWRGYLLGVWQRRQKSHPQIRELYDSKLIIAQDLLRQWVEAHPDWKWPVTFDDWYTQPAFCCFLDQTLGLPYVGTLSGSDKVNLRTGQTTLQEFAERLKQEHAVALQHGGKPVFSQITIPFKGDQETCYSYCNTRHIHNFGKQRLVINYRQADLSDNPAFFIPGLTARTGSNRLVWQAAGITRIRRHRWPCGIVPIPQGWSVEVYHEEGKAEGLNQYQLRDFGGIERHVALVAVVYSLLRAAQHDPDPSG